MAWSYNSLVYDPEDFCVTTHDDYTGYNESHDK